MPDKLSGEERKKFRKFFEKYQAANVKLSQMKRDFDEQLIKIYGEEHYSDHDKDEIIDSLDYGLGGLTFKRFDEIMKEINPGEKIE